MVDCQTDGRPSGGEVVWKKRPRRGSVNWIPETPVPTPGTGEQGLVQREAGHRHPRPILAASQHVHLRQAQPAWVVRKGESGQKAPILIGQCRGTIYGLSDLRARFQQRDGDGPCRLPSVTRHLNQRAGPADSGAEADGHCHGRGRRQRHCGRCR